MKKNLFLLAGLLLLLASCKQSEEKVNVRWATFNLRYDVESDSLNSWTYRKDRVAEYIDRQGLDVVGTQEALHHQFTDLKERLPLYEGVGVGREDGKQGGEYSAIFFRKDKFELLDSNTFWLSEYPDSVGLKGWDAACIRIATWAKLKDKKTGKVFMAVNTHFDHIGVEARKQSALLIISKIKEVVGDRPAVLTGDFNVTDESDAYATITGNEFVLLDARKQAAEVVGVDYSYHGFARASSDSRNIIDFLFITPSITVRCVEIPQENPEALLSDHSPVVADLEF